VDLTQLLPRNTSDWVQVGVIFVGIRFFGFFPKAQPPRIGSVKPPPKSVILAALYALWIGVTACMTLVLAGGAF